MFSEDAWEAVEVGTDNNAVGEYQIHGLVQPV